MIEGDLDQQLLDIQRDYLTFLDDEEDEGYYLNQVKEMVTEKKSRLIVNINDLRKKKPERAARLLKHGAEEIVAFQNALKEFVGSVDPTYEKDEFFIGFEGSFGSRHVNPRTLRASFMNNLVCLEGIITRCSLVKAKLVKSVHYCPATDKRSERKYSDPFSLNHTGLAANVSAYPTKDIDGNLLETEYGLSVFKNQQIVVVQEMPEKAPRGQLPRAVEIVCDHDLADRCQLGDRVQVVGVYKSLPSAKNGYTTCVFRTVLIACHIAVMSKDIKLMFSRDDLKLCRKLAKRPNIFDILSQSLAPSIHGHEYVKKGILCLLLGGVEKILANGTRLRGDINILLIGDPSVAKSQLLRYVLTTAPRAISTTGRGCSGVGLTAAVAVDRDTGEKCLEAGAMVLADRGIVCIDEFDKMSDIDRTAIHEVMEQGRVSISKAGIQARLNARCSVLAAGNPLYGRYDPYRTPMENIGMQDSLLSRFDLIFVLLDSINQDVDSMIADHVIRMLRYRDPNEQDGEVLPLSSTVDILTTKNLDEEDEGELQVFEKYDPLLHGAARKKSNVLTVKFMKLYLNVAKSLKPTLTDEASESLAEEYARLRSQDAIQDGQARTQPVTARTLETLIRLASAHAKARLSTKIDKKDAEAAIELVQFAYFKKVLEKERKRRKRDSDDETDGDSDNDDETEARGRRVRRKRDDTDAASFCPGSEADTLFSQEEPATVDEPMAVDVDDNDTNDEGEITEERFQEFKKAAAAVWQELPVQSINLNKMKKRINEIVSATPFTPSEFKAATRRMSDDNQIMVCDNIVYLI